MQELWTVGRTFWFGAMLLVISACAEKSGLNGVANTPTVEPLPTVLETPTPAQQEDVSRPDAVVDVEALNMRIGPGIAYEKVGLVLAGDELRVVGEAFGCQWLLIETVQGDGGWVSAAFLTLDLDCDEIEAAAFPTAPASTAVPVIATVLPTVPADVAVVPEQATQGLAVALMRPVEDVLRGRVTFEWQPLFGLGENQAFELVFWRPGQDPLADGFSPIGSTMATEVAVDLETAIAALPPLQAGVDYRWGVLLVQVEPYGRIQFLVNQQAFRLEHEADLVPVSTREETPAATVTLAPAPVPTDTPTATPELTATLAAAPKPTDTPAATTTTPTPIDTATPDLGPSPSPTDTDVP